MMETLDAAMQHLLAWLALPEYGLTTLFIVCFVSATLLPLASEPALLGLLQLNPQLFWPAILVATAGNTLGGVVDWWMGYAAKKTLDKALETKKALASDASHRVASRWLQRFGPAACLLGWLPFVGDPLCAVAGWLRLPFWPCAAYMALGKFARYIVMTMAFNAMFK